MTSFVRQPLDCQSSPLLMIYTNIFIAEFSPCMVSVFLKPMTNIALMPALLSTFSRFKYFLFFAAKIDLSVLLIRFQVSYDDSFVYSSFHTLFLIAFFALWGFVPVKMWLCSVPTSQAPLYFFWFKLTDGPNVSTLTSIKSSDTIVTLHNEYKREKLSSNFVKLKLTIKQVNSSDSVWYFCGFSSNNSKNSEFNIFNSGR